MDTVTNVSNINNLWCTLAIEELVRNGIDYFCLSPGSRSAPLTVAAARHPHARRVICIDERAAAFHALGYARATGRAAALICTSGTAVANYLPAVVEASADNVPLLILSADRPPELRHTGANQTIQQPGIFAPYVRWEFDMPCPDVHIAPQFVLSTVDYARFRTLSPVPGPVHLNWMFREPLAPVADPAEDFSLYLTSVQHWMEATTPYAWYDRPHVSAGAVVTADIAQRLNDARAPLLVVGKLHSAEETRAVATLAETTGIPVCADIASGLHTGNPGSNIVPFIDQLLLSPDAAALLQPDVILHLGGQITSKRLTQFLDAQSAALSIIVKPHPFRHDPSHAAMRHVQSDLVPFCEALTERLAQRTGTPDILRHLSTAIDRGIDAWLAQDDQISEMSVARTVSREIPNNWGLFLSNSMPIRDMDMYAATDGAHVRIGVNRGASGIDGIIASAAGFAAGLGAPVTLVIGDLAFLHDVNSLVLTASLAQPLVIVVINNSGGGIFSFLPIAAHDDVFEQYFGTPQLFGIEHAARMANVDYYAPDTNGQFLEAYNRATSRGKTAVIEVRTERENNLQRHRQLQLELATLIAKTIQG